MTHNYNAKVASDLTRYAGELKRIRSLRVAEILPHTKTTTLLRSSKLNLAVSGDRQKLLTQIDNSGVRTIVERLSKPQSPVSVDKLVEELTTPKLRVVNLPKKGETKTG